MRNLLPLIIIFTLSVWSFKAHGQFIRIADRVIVAGYVFEESNGSPLPYVNVYVKQRRIGTITDTSGYFILKAEINDTLIFSSMGYNKKYVVITDTAADNDKPLIVFLEQRIYEIRSVDIVALRRYKQLEYDITTMELPKDDYYNALTNFPFRPVDIDYYTRDVTPVSGIGVVFSPITALYDAFSKEGKEKQKLAEIQGQDYLNSLIEEKISIAVIMKITGMNREDTNVFLEWCNFSPDFILRLTEYDLVLVIKHKYNQYSGIR